MPYEPQTWVDFNPKYVLSAVRMEHIEEGLVSEELRAKEAENTAENQAVIERNRAQGAETAIRNEITTEKNRAETAESGFASLVGTEKARAENSETTIKGEVAAEKARAEGVENTVKGTVTTEKARAEAAEIQAQKKAEEKSIPLTQKGAANGVATLGAGGLIPSAQLPPAELAETKTVATEAEMIALKPSKTTIVIVGGAKTYIWNGGKSNTSADWTELKFSGIQELNGKTGSSVSLSAADVGADVAGAATAAQTAAIANAAAKVAAEESRAKGVEETNTATATNAKTKAEEATTASATAKTAAESAKTTAETAKTTAENAKTEAAAAKTEATSAKGEASASKTESVAAKKAAKEAEEAATAAKGESKAAKEAATNALTESTAAKKAAEAAEKEASIARGEILPAVDVEKKRATGVEGPFDERIKALESTPPGTGGGSSVSAWHATFKENGTLIINEFSPVDAATGALTMTLPSPVASKKGSIIVVEKIDNSPNPVKIEGSIRGQVQALYLRAAHESLFMEADGSGSWWPLVRPPVVPVVINPVDYGILARDEIGPKGEEGKTEDQAGKFQALILALEAKAVKGTQTYIIQGRAGSEYYLNETSERWTSPKAPEAKGAKTLAQEEERVESEGFSKIKGCLHIDKNICLANMSFLVGEKVESEAEGAYVCAINILRPGQTEICLQGIQVNTQTRLGEEQLPLYEPGTWKGGPNFEGSVVEAEPFIKEIPVTKIGGKFYFNKPSGGVIKVEEPEREVILKSEVGGFGFPPETFIKSIIEVTPKLLTLEMGNALGTETVNARGTKTKEKYQERLVYETELDCIRCNTGGVIENVIVGGTSRFRFGQTIYGDHMTARHCIFGGWARIAFPGEGYQHSAGNNLWYDCRFYGGFCAFYFGPGGRTAGDSIIGGVFGKCQGPYFYSKYGSFINPTGSTESAGLFINALEINGAIGEAGARGFIVDESLTRAIAGLEIIGWGMASSDAALNGEITGDPRQPADAFIKAGSISGLNVIGGHVLMGAGWEGVTATELTTAVNLASLPKPTSIQVANIAVLPKPEEIVRMCKGVFTAGNATIKEIYGPLPKVGQEITGRFINNGNPLTPAKVKAVNKELKTIEVNEAKEITGSTQAKQPKKAQVKTRFSYGTGNNKPATVIIAGARVEYTEISGNFLKKLTLRGFLPNELLPVGTTVQALGTGGCAVMATGTVSNNNFGRIDRAIEKCSKQNVPFMRCGSQYNNRAEAGTQFGVEEEGAGAIEFRTMDTAVDRFDLLQRTVHAKTKGFRAKSYSDYGGTIGGLALLPAEAGDTIPVMVKNPTSPTRALVKTAKVGTGEEEHPESFPLEERGAKCKLEIPYIMGEGLEPPILLFKTRINEEEPGALAVISNTADLPTPAAKQRIHVALGKSIVFYYKKSIGQYGPRVVGFLEEVTSLKPKVGSTPKTLVTRVMKVNSFGASTKTEVKIEKAKFEKVEGKTQTIITPLGGVPAGVEVGGWVEAPEVIGTAARIGAVTGTTITVEEKPETIPVVEKPLAVVYRPKPLVEATGKFTEKSNTITMTSVPAGIVEGGYLEATGLFHGLVKIKEVTEGKNIIVEGGTGAFNTTEKPFTVIYTPGTFYENEKITGAISGLGEWITVLRSGGGALRCTAAGKTFTFLYSACVEEEDENVAKKVAIGKFIRGVYCPTKKEGVVELPAETTLEDITSFHIVSTRGAGYLTKNGSIYASNLQFDYEEMIPLRNSATFVGITNETGNSLISRIERREGAEKSEKTRKEREKEEELESNVVENNKFVFGGTQIAKAVVLPAPLANFSLEVLDASILPSSGQLVIALNNEVAKYTYKNVNFTTNTLSEVFYEGPIKTGKTIPIKTPVNWLPGQVSKEKPLRTRKGTGSGENAISDNGLVAESSGPNESRGYAYGMMVEEYGGVAEVEI